MIRWVVQRCFSNLELDSQKNRLLFFLLSVPVFLLAEINISTHYSFFDPVTIQFLSFYIVFVGIMFACLLRPSLEKPYKYLFITGMIVFAIYQLFIFNQFALVYQIMYINLALALIYLDGSLILYAGIMTSVLSAVCYLLMKDYFFPVTSTDEIVGSIIIILQITCVLWGVTRIGTRFHHYVDHNQEMQLLLQENEHQFMMISEQNRTLTQYAQQVEQLTILEERNRISRELHDTLGHTFTSMIAGLEMLRHVRNEESAERIEPLLETARKGLENLRDHVHQVERQGSHQPISAQIEQLARELALNTGASVEVHTDGAAVELVPPYQLALLRCAQEALTNAIRHGRADRIGIRLSFSSGEVRLELEDNGKGTNPGTLQYGFGLQSMKQRIEALQGTLQVSAGLDQGVSVVCVIPLHQRHSQGTIRVLLVEDQELIAESFRILLNLEPDVNVVEVAGNGKVAIEVCESGVPDVILMDIHMPEMNGVQATKVIKERWPHVKIIILTTFQDVDNATEAISLGAEGYLLKSVQPRHLAESIRIVHSGGTFISMETAQLLVTGINKAQGSEHTPIDPPSVAAINIQDQVRPHGGSAMYNLTSKELEILQFLALGMKYKEIAHKLHFSESTIRNYVSIIYSKLNVENRMQAVNKAQEHSLLQT